MRLVATATTYRQLKSFTNRDGTERSSPDNMHPIRAGVKLYVLPQDKGRIEIKGGGNLLQSVLISDGRAVTGERSAIRARISRQVRPFRAANK